MTRWIALLVLVACGGAATEDAQPPEGPLTCSVGLGEGYSVEAHIDEAVTFTLLDRRARIPATRSLEDAQVTYSGTRLGDITAVYDDASLTVLVSGEAVDAPCVLAK